MSFDRRYYSRQVVLDGFGEEAQKKLARSHALVAGLGGTGCAAATCLALAGVGRISLVDRDVVSLENLHRQPVYRKSDIGKSKAEAAAGFLSERASGVALDYRTDSIAAGNALRILGTADIAIDCLDNMEARLSLNGACVKRAVPMVHTGGTGWEATVAVFWSPGSACLECLIRPGGAELPSCEQIGVLGALTSFAGSAGALEVLKLLAGIRSSLVGRMLYYDGGTARARVVDIAKRSTCGACGSGTRRGGPDGLVQLCGDEYYQSRAFAPRAFASLSRRFREDSRAMGDSVLLVGRDRAEVSLFRSGGALVKGVSSLDEARALLTEMGLTA